MFKLLCKTALQWLSWLLKLLVLELRARSMVSVSRSLLISQCPSFLGLRMLSREMYGYVRTSALHRKLNESDNFPLKEKESGGGGHVQCSVPKCAID